MCEQSHRARDFMPHSAASATIPHLGYPMSNQVLIVAGESAARTPARVAQSLRLDPIIAATEEEALALIDAHSFSLVAVGDEALWQRMREIIEARRPMTRVLRLPEGNGGDDVAVRRLLTRYLDPHTKTEPHQFSEKRYQFLSQVLESFTSTLELKEVVRRIVTLTREEFVADRAWLLQSVTEENEFAKVAFAVSSRSDGEVQEREPIPLKGSLNLIRRAMESADPIAIAEGDADLDPELAARYDVKSELVQILRPRDGELLGGHLALGHRRHVAHPRDPPRAAPQGGLGGAQGPRDPPEDPLREEPGGLGLPAAERLTHTPFWSEPQSRLRTQLVRLI